MSKTITVEVPDDVPYWLVESAVLNAIEPGAATHCRQVPWDPQGIIGSRHPRLGVTIKEVR